MGDGAAWRRGGGGGQALSILGIDPGVSEGGPVIWPACQEQMCPKGRRDHRMCDLKMQPSQEGRASPGTRGKEHIVEPGRWPPLGSDAEGHKGSGDKSHSCTEVRAYPG